MAKVDLIVTRHAALKAYLIEKGVADETTPVLPHASAEQVRGKRVAGVLPIHLVAETSSFTTVELALPLEMRGRELSLDDMRRYCRGLRSFVCWETTELEGR